MDFNKNNNIPSIPWMDDDPLEEQSTSIPDVIEGTTQIGTLIIFIISAILIITSLFIIAVFIDCRQQKLTQLQTNKRRKRIVRLKIPKIGGPVRDDEHTIVDRMQEEPSTSSNGIV